MPRPLKYPQLLDLKIGESLYVDGHTIPIVSGVQSLRNMASEVGKRYGITLKVHYRWKERFIEIRRVEPPKPVEATIGASQPRKKSRAEMYAEIDRIQAELNAQD